jgi:hypothetical protein
MTSQITCNSQKYCGENVKSCTTPKVACSLLASYFTGKNSVKDNEALSVYILIRGSTVIIIFVFMESMQLPMRKLFENTVNLKLNHEGHYLSVFTWHCSACLVLYCDLFQSN